MTPRLECKLTVGYDGVPIVRDIGLSVQANEILALLGPNGAGKTTLLFSLAGFLAPIDGTITLDGQNIRPGSPRRMNRAGIVLVPDHRALFTQLTTIENLKVAARKLGPSTDDILDLFPALRRRTKVHAGMLSGGEQQMLTVARALMQHPRVLLIDELSMGLAPLVVESLMPTLRWVADEAGAAIVLVEQHVSLALQLADHAIVLVHGEIRLSGPASKLRSDTEALEAAYLSGLPG